MKKHLLSFGFLLLLGIQAYAQKPVANFSESVDTICDNDCISFTDLSTNNPTSWFWTFTGALPSTSTDQDIRYVCYEQAGSYDVKLVVTNSFGSDSIIKNNLILVSPVPPVPALTFYLDTFFCKTDPSYVSYQWYDSSTLIPGATDTFLVINSYPCDYNIRVCNVNGCCIASGINILCGLGINALIDGKEFSLYPNPATNQLTLHPVGWTSNGVNTSFNNEHATISIMNVLGMETSPPAPLQRRGESEAIDVSGLAAGVYFLQLRSACGNVTKMFVKE